MQFHDKLLPAQGKLDKCFQTNEELGWFLFFSSELPYKSLFTEERNRLIFFKTNAKSSIAFFREKGFVKQLTPEETNPAPFLFGNTCPIFLVPEVAFREIELSFCLRHSFFEGGCCYAALMRPKKVETRLQLQLGRWPCGC